MKTNNVFIYAIVNCCMNINNHKINNGVNISNNSKAIIMGMLLLAATFSMMISNTISTAFAQSGYPNVGCIKDTMGVSIYEIPKQTSYLHLNVPIVNVSPDKDHAEANVAIPGIGSGKLTIDYTRQMLSYQPQLSGFPGQTGPSYVDSVRAPDICPGGEQANIVIPGIGDGVLGDCGWMNLSS